MRQKTRWRFVAKGGDGAYIRVGRIYHNHFGIKEDIVRYQILSSDKNMTDCIMTADEAALLSAGLSVVISEELQKRDRLADE